QPIVLCLLHGVSQDEAAAQLGWSPGSVKGRLERGKEVLRRRLSARGVTLSAALTAAVVSSVPVAVPPRLFARTLDVAAGAAVSIAAAVGGPDDAAPKPAPSQPKPPAAQLDHFGDPLPPGAVARLGTLRFNAGMWPHHIAPSPDGSKIATVGSNLSQTQYLTI